MTTKRAFLEHYRAELVRRFAWAQEATKLNRFMDGVEITINGGAKLWVHEGDAVTAAWRAIGEKGKPTLKALVALPGNF
jgi:hypothetical protein